MNQPDQAQIPGLTKSTLIKLALGLPIILGFLIVSYIGLNQPICPLCQDRTFVKYTLVIHKNKDSGDMNLRNIGMAGLCIRDKTLKEVDKMPHLCWFCFKHRKRIIKPKNWRSE